jgi:hypothetical protein
MPERKTLERARKAKRAGKAPTTQAGEFVHEEMEHIRKGKHGARSTKQAIAIGLSKARRSGVKLKPPKRGQASTRARKSAARAYRAGQKSGTRKRPSATRSRAIKRALKREPRRAASRRALSKQARAAAPRRRKRAASSTASRRRRRTTA